MTLKQVSLDPFLLAQLYKSPVIPFEKTESSATHSSVKFLGNNSRHITLLVDNRNQPWLPEELFSLLTKILQACGLSMDDVALVNVASLPQKDLSGILEQLATEKLILFGSSFREWTKQRLEKNQINRLEGCPCLFSDSLQELKDNAQLKKAFWQTLQQFFELRK